MSDTTFMGLPIEGDLTRYPRAATPQKPIEEFAPLMQAVLDDPFVAQVIWTQYTPHFNDGDPCEFGIHGVGFVTVDDLKALLGDPQDGPLHPYDFEVDYEHPTLGMLVESDWLARSRDLKIGDYVPGDGGVDRRETLVKCRALSSAIQSGAFEDVLQEAFGDHAKIVVTREGITVEHYDHD